MKLKHGIAAVIILFSVGLGFWASTSSYRGLIFVHSDYFDNGRNPAAIRRVFDFSHLEGSALQLASQKRLLTDAHILTTESGMIGIELGHFVTRTSEGRRLLACEYYDRVNVLFEAEGVADGGEKPTMEVEGPCSVPLTEDLNRIAPLWIPVARITEQKPANFEAMIFPDLAGVQFRFNQIGTEWPKHWILRGVRLYNQQESGREVSISAAEIRKISPKPITIRF